CVECVVIVRLPREITWPVAIWGDLADLAGFSRLPSAFWNLAAFHNISDIMEGCQVPESTWQPGKARQINQIAPDGHRPSYFTWQPNNNDALNTPEGRT
ncbi:MAG TPA: hypothetical protein VM450_18230, partial [Thermomicrobiales bacterium]|nr:hypothetical protein [Thermomicrobiales bacterium]